MLACSLRAAYLLSIVAADVALAIPPRGLTPKPRVSPTPTRPPGPSPTAPPVTPTPTPVTPTVTSKRWQIAIRPYDEGNETWAPWQTYEVTGGRECRLLMESPCAVKVEAK